MVLCCRINVCKVVDALQITFASNYYGPLYLTELLLPIMKKTPSAGGITKRIVWVTSIGSQLANPPVLKTDLIPWNDLKCGIYQIFHVYLPQCAVVHRCLLSYTL